MWILICIMTRIMMHIDSGNDNDTGNMDNDLHNDTDFYMHNHTDNETDHMDNDTNDTDNHTEDD